MVFSPMWPWHEEVHMFPDRVFRDLLEDPKNAREFLGVALDELAAAFDLDKVKVVPSVFLMDDWRRRDADLIFHVPFRTGEGSILVCVMVEHQSSPDPLMPLRLEIYSRLYWNKQLEEWERSPPPREPLRLIPIIPIVLYTGPRPWGTNRELRDLIDWPPDLERFAPHWPILIWNLCEQSIDGLLKSSGHWLRSLAVVRAEREETDVFVEVFEKTIEELKSLKAHDRPRWRRLLRATISWGMRRRPDEDAPKVAQVALDNFEPDQDREEIEFMEKAFKSFEQTLMERGEIQARREDLHDLLTDRFGELPSGIVEKIQATEDIDRLKNAVRQAYRIDSLDDLPL